MKRITAKEPRSSLIDSLRALAIFLVLVTHMEPLLPKNGSGIVAQFIHMVAESGYIGVGIFFSVSGYIITRRMLITADNPFNPDAADFYLRRVSRIWPLLSFVVVVGSVALAIGGDGHAFTFVFDTGKSAFGSAFFISIATFTFNWLRLSQGGGNWGLHWDVLWSLSVEEQFYLFYPWLLWLTGNLKRLRWILLAAIVVGIARRWMLLNHNMDGFTAYLDSTYGFAQMAPGMYGAFMAPTLDARTGSRRLCLVLGAALLPLTICLMWFYNQIFIVSVIVPVIMASAAAMIMASSGNNLGEDRSAKKSSVGLPPIFWRLLKPWCLMGEVSYGLYLLHPLILFLLAPWLPRLPAFAALALFLFTSTAAARVSYVWFEKPAWQFIRQAWRGHKLQRAIRREL